MSALLNDIPPRPEGDLRRALAARYVEGDGAVVGRLVDRLAHARVDTQRVARLARMLAEKLREQADEQTGVEAFMHVYKLSSREGMLLMCMAEALLRIPDTETQDRLIKDKLTDADWLSHITKGAHFLLNASAYGLMLSGRVIGLDAPGEGYGSRIRQTAARLGEPVIREAVRQAMRVLGRQFVLGQTIEQATERARRAERNGFRYSYDMLGEAARTAEDASRYWASYRASIDVIAASTGSRSTGGRSHPSEALMERPGLSIKLSALHPRYEIAKWKRLDEELYPRLLSLLEAARARDISVTIDAEESERLEPSLDLIERLARADSLQGWNGVGLAVQAYQKRAHAVVDWLQDLAQRSSRRIPVRLVKGAYWDYEIKRAQSEGIEDFPVFTRKVSTDVSYMACAHALLEGGDAFYPQFATHNAHTLSWVLEAAGNRSGFEFQKLHGMGESLYKELSNAVSTAVPCRVYAPVGSHRELLPYLVRRLLENGANSSFVHKVVDPNTALDALVEDPVEKLSRLEPKRHPAIARPPELFGKTRRNSMGVDLAAHERLEKLAKDLQAHDPKGLERPSTVPGGKGEWVEVTAPADRRVTIGRVQFADAATAKKAVDVAARGFRRWSGLPVARRSAMLAKTADLMEHHHAELLALCVREAGKTVRDSVADLREAIDFLRYYALEAERLMAAPQELPGVTGERNTLSLHPRGVFVVISPWNFPIAIFTGQTAAALAAGNAVVTKPAEATSLLAHRICDLMHEAGVPEDALICLPARGREVGEALVTHPATAGVAFTGSTETARAINRAMAATDLPVRPLIAETGGINAMIVDNSALAEQAVADIVESAFRSAGQRCSALRLLLVQSESADRLTKMLAGAMAELKVGDPGELATDVGPVIDEPAREKLTAHAGRMEREARLIHRCDLGAECAHGTFVPPTAFELKDVGQLQREVFGPILHVLRYEGDALDAAVDAVNAKGFGLTFGVQSRIDHTIERACARIEAGNVYVNRNIIGAIVGSQ
ncbi:MAG: bifunctional proline dehydrogenase/L-glutamate gamma-semialdehyde dehydrogenase PutA, partial [Geminicoccaceae bacterium]|nr:bifunctional proline dehydrogenase/L-glutamate gamma-semialdehyde dehydrogenase PutA [Geminicoccaceae bacterium]